MRRNGMAFRESEEAHDAAQAIELDLPDVCVAGVVDNRRLLAEHALLLTRFFEAKAAAEAARDA